MISHRYFETGRCYHPNYKTPEPAVLELWDSASIYIFLFIGIVVAFIILGIEMLVKYTTKKRNEQVRHSAPLSYSTV